MPMNRRNFIKVMGSSAVIVAAGSLNGCDSMPKSAIAPWRPQQAPHKDIRVQLLSYAILAPNPHNMQPWMVHLSSTSHRIILYCDSERLLPMTDPESRQIFIGHGAFLELLDLAASAQGYDTRIQYFPEGGFDPAQESRPVAIIDLVKNENRKKDPLFHEILKRRSTKEPFVATPLQASHAAELQTAFSDSQISMTTAMDPQQVQRLREWAWEAWKIEVFTPRTYQESVDVMRIGADEVAKHPDGIDILGTGIWWGRMFGMVSREKIADPKSEAFQVGVDQYEEMFQNTPGFLWMVSDNNSRPIQLRIGRAYARLNLKATQLGVAMHPVSQILQEYKEMQPLQQQFLKYLNVPKSHRMQLLMRVGYAEFPGPSPRRPVQDLFRCHGSSACAGVDVL